MKYKHFFLAIILIFIPFAFLAASTNNSLAKKLEGRILLQVQGKGEAWYVYPGDLKRYYMGRPRDAFSLMQQLGKGISTENLKKIPVGILDSNQKDSDQDGLGDTLEEALGTDINNPDTDNDGYSDLIEIQKGYDPLSRGQWQIDSEFVDNYRGHILLQVEDKGQGWYVNPVDGKRYFLGNPFDAFTLMKKLALGITNKNLEKITSWKKRNWTVVEEKQDSSGNTSGTYQFSIEERNRSFVVEFSCSKQFSDMSLVTPGGVEIDKERADALEQYIYYTVPEKKKAYFGIKNAQQGTWNINRKNQEAGSCTVEIYLYIDING